MMAHSTFVALSYIISAIVFFILIIAIVIDGKTQKKKLSRLETLNANKHQQKQPIQQKEAK